MMKRLARFVLGLGAAGLAAACLWSLAEGGGGSSGFSVPPLMGIGKVADTVAVNAIAPGEIDTTGAVTTTGCDRMLLVGLFDGDSCAYWVDYSADGTVWYNNKDSSFVNGTPTAVGSWYTWSTPPDTAWITDSTWSAITRDRIDGTPTAKVRYQLVQAITIGAVSVPTFRSFMYDYVRLRIHNIDTADTMRSNVWTIRCED
jgi:hypothetical protein